MYREFEFIQFDKTTKKTRKWSPAVKYLLEMTDSQLSATRIDQLFPCIEKPTRLVTGYGNELWLYLFERNDLLIIKDCTKVVELYSKFPSGIIYIPNTSIPNTLESNKLLPIVFQMNAYGIVDISHPLTNKDESCYSLMSLIHPKDTLLVTRLIKNTISTTNSYCSNVEMYLNDQLVRVSISTLYSPNYIYLRVDHPKPSNSIMIYTLSKFKQRFQDLINAFSLILLKILNEIMASFNQL